MLNPLVKNLQLVKSSFPQMCTDLNTWIGADKDQTGCDISAHEVISDFIHEVRHLFPLHNACSNPQALANFHESASPT